MSRHSPTGRATISSSSTGGAIREYAGIRRADGSLFRHGRQPGDSADSRVPNSGVGFVPAENLVGRAEFIFFSIGGTSPGWEFWKWPFEIRYGRLFTSID